MKANSQSTNDLPEVQLLPKPLEWRSIPWRKLERKVYKLQKRIYAASQRGETLKVRQLQRLLLKSRAAKLLAVRRVTQENQGRKTAGVDGVKALTPHQRLKLVKQLRINGLATPTRRVWIPKPDRSEKRPLGIPIMLDRAKQKLIELALDPEWEARFEPNSYGFRKGRSCHDAIKAVRESLKHTPKWVLDADIAKCFDRINHSALLNKLNTTPSIRRQINAWLKSGVMDGMKYFDTQEGTPQGGVISPLLANIALHGIENRIKQAFPNKNIYRNGKYVGRQKEARLIRYADDFVLLHDNLAVIKQAQKIVSEWLDSMGLELKPEKTRITHTLEGGLEYATGFNFLGFHVQQFKVGKHQIRTKDKLNRFGYGFSTVITPSREKVQTHLDKIREKILVGKSKTLPQVKLIDDLNQIIRGWASYYRTVNSKKTFAVLNHLVYLKLWRWAYRRHPKKNKTWIADRYWDIEGKGWIFTDKKTGARLIRHSDIKLMSPGCPDGKEYVKVKGDRSPYDGEIAYWAARIGFHPELPQKKALLMKQQRQRCTHCGLFITDIYGMEVHHKDGNRKNNQWSNLELLHLVCHDRIHGKQTYVENNQADGNERQDGISGVSIDKFPFYI